MEKFRSSESANDLGAESASYVRSVCPHEITEDNFDQLGMLQQLGVIPSPEQAAG